jgi:hypothetical protein
MQLMEGFSLAHAFAVFDEDKVSFILGVFQVKDGS